MINTISKIISNAIYVIACVLIILLGGTRIFGYTPYAITSGSMIPEYKVGSLVYVKEIAFEELNVGDDISFYLNDGVIATHRINSIDDENKQIQTYGINNRDSDGNQINDASPVDYDRVVGRVEFTIPALGYLYIFTRTTTGKIAFVVIVMVILGISQLLKVFYSEREKKA